MKKMNRWGLAAGLAAALALHGTAQAQSATGGSPSAPPPSGSPSGSPSSDSASGAKDTPAASERAGQGSQGTGSSMGRESGTTGTTSRESGTTAGQTAGTGSTAQAGQKLDKGLQESLEKIHAANQAELHMAQMGQQNAQSPQVKEFAQKMGEDHQRLDQKLTQTVQTLGATLEGKSFEKERDKAMKDMDKLQKKTGADFDKEYMDHMVKDHERSLKDVKDAAKDARKNNHTELASLLESAQGGMQGHLDQAKQIRDSLKQEPRRAAGTERPGAATGTGSGAADQRGTGSSGSGKAGPTGASDSGAGGPGTGTGSPGSGANPTLPGRDNPPGGAQPGSSQPGGSTSR